MHFRHMEDNQNYKRAAVTFLLSLLIVFVSSSCFSKTEISTVLLKQLIIDLSDDLSGNDLNLKKLQTILEVAPSRFESGKYWTFESTKYPIHVSAASVDLASPVTEITITLSQSNKLTLKDLAEVFGEYRLISKSKTSSVKFNYRAGEGKTTLVVYATLLFPPSDKDSPVLRIDLRQQK